MINDSVNKAMAESAPELPKTEKEDKGLYGWICPKCGAVMSPYTSYCVNCLKPNFAPTLSVSDPLPANIGTELKYLFYNRKDNLGYE